MSRTRMMLLLLIVLCVAVGYAWIAMPEQRRVIPGQGAPYQTEQQWLKVFPASFPVITDLDFSGGGDNSYQKPQKNLFAPLYLPPKAVKPRPVAKVTKLIAKPQKVIPTVFQPQGPKPIQPLDVLGYLNKDGIYTVFLSSKQGEIYLAKIGDFFSDGLSIKSINSEKVIIGRRGTDQQVVLSLGEAKSQRLPKIALQSGRPQFKVPKKPKPDKKKPVAAPAVDNVIRAADDIFKPYKGDR
ncbi:MAG: hypothetical protein KAG93_07455 [Desulfuromusa sp.]|nr:hypothetical protein [Desulfuromusa sp.]